MPLAPEPILCAGNDAVYLACVFCRSAALNGTASNEMIAELMDAVHAVPNILTNWQVNDSPDTIRSHLGCFEATRWPGMPDLVAHFDERLRTFGVTAA